MRNNFLLFIILLGLTPFASIADLTVPDLEKIDEKIREADKDQNTHIDRRFNDAKQQMDNNTTLINGRFDSIEKQLDRNHNLSLAILALTGSIVVGLISITLWYIRKGESLLINAKLVAESSQVLINNANQLLEHDTERDDRINKLVTELEEILNKMKPDLQQQKISHTN